MLPVGVNDEIKPGFGIIVYHYKALKPRITVSMGYRANEMKPY
jgi:hypothetical protein